MTGYAPSKVLAEAIREQWDRAHATALTEPGLCDGVYILQSLALRLVEQFTIWEPGFDRQAFLALAIDQPGTTAVWDGQ